jgi:hypothetical protein
MHYCAIDEVENTQTTTIDVHGPIAGGTVDDTACGTGPAATRRRAFDSPLAFQVNLMTMQSGTSPTADTATDWQARVAVRVPRDGSGDLTADAAQRLASAELVNEVDVEHLAGLEPALAATVVQLDVRATSREATASTIRESLAGAPGVQRVERMESAVDRRPKRYGPPP